MKACSLYRIRRKVWIWFYLVLIVFLGAFPSPHGTSMTLAVVGAWEWSDYFVYIQGSALTSSSTNTLSINEVSELRVRDIKRRLSRTHGYSAEELGRVLDKKDLIQMLAFEEEKLRLQQEDSAKRIVLQHGIVGCVVAVLVILCWPLFSHAYEIAMVNFVVYTDRKKLELQRCLELRSYQGLLGVIFMGILDLLQLWLTASVILSWVTTSKYFFPIPRLTLRPAQFMGADAASSSMANYGINVGSILVTYGMRYVYSWIERFTGTALSNQARRQRREARQHETADDAAVRKAARRAVKLENLERQRQQQVLLSAINRPVPQPPPEWMSSDTARGNHSIPPIVTRGSHSHQEFLQQLNEDALCEQEDAWDADGTRENDDSQRQSKFDELD